MRLKLFIITILFSTLRVLAQDVEFKAIVQRKTIGKFDKFQIDFKINKRANNIKPPDFSDFAYLGGPSTSVSQSWVNGKTTFSKKYTYFLMPKKTGKFTIGAAKIEVDGITYRTKPIVMNVVEDTPANNMKRDDPFSIAKRNIKFVLNLSTTNPYVNQQIIATYYLYFKGRIGQPHILEYPKFNGFWSQDFEENYNVEDKYLDGELYQRIVLKKTVLTPQKSGKLFIEPFLLNVPIEVSTGQIDFWGNRISHQRDYSISVKKRTINVKALPVEGKPIDFSGAVGKYTFDVSSNKTTVDANESIIIKAVVKGNGNLKLFDIPKLNVPEEIEVYEPKHSDNVRVTSRGMTGSVKEEYIVIPRYKGKYKIPALKFSYFDTSSKKYITLKGKEFIIDVTKGKKPTGISNTNNYAISKSDVELLGKDIRFIHGNAEFEEIKTRKLFDTLLYYVLLLLPFVSIPIIMYLKEQNRRHSSDLVSVRRKKAAKKARKRLLEASKALENNDEVKFYEAVIQSMYKYLAHSLNLQQSQLNKESIQEKLKSKGASEVQIKDLMDLLSECEIARYTPNIESDNKNVIYNKALELILELEKIK